MPPAVPNWVLSKKGPVFREFHSSQWHPPLPSLVLLCSASPSNYKVSLRSKRCRFKIFKVRCDECAASRCEGEWTCPKARTVGIAILLNEIVIGSQTGESGKGQGVIGCVDHRTRTLRKACWPVFEGVAIDDASRTPSDVGRIAGHIETLPIGWRDRLLEW